MVAIWIVLYHTTLKSIKETVNGKVCHAPIEHSCNKFSLFALSISDVSHIFSSTNTQLQFKLFTLNLAKIHDQNTLAIMTKKDPLFSFLLPMSHIQYLWNETLIVVYNKLLYPFTMSSVLKLCYWNVRIAFSPHISLTILWLSSSIFLFKSLTLYSFTLNFSSISLFFSLHLNCLSLFILKRHFLWKMKLCKLISISW